MRALKVLLFVTALASLVSCSKDDDPQVDHSMLLGEWDLSELSYTGTTSVNDGTETATVSYTGEGIDMDAQVVFVDGSNYTTAGSYTVKLTTTVDGETNVQDYYYSDLTGNGTYKIEGNKMTTTPQGGGEGQIIQASEAIIQELTPNRIVFFIEQESVTTVEGMEVQISLEMIQVLTR